MTQHKKIYYWSPYLVNIATPRAVINSAYALEKYSEAFKCYIVNFFGEFNIFAKKSDLKNLRLINFYDENIIKYLPKHGFFQSRFSFIVLFILGLIPLKKLIEREKPDYLIIHLITALPLFLLTIFKFDTKFILRISGKPKLGYLRKLFWKLALKKIYLVTCPTLSTLNYLKSIKIVEENKLKLLYDPIINIKEFLNKKTSSQNNYFKKKDYFFAAGRLTYQKNFLFICRNFKYLISKYPNLKLVIAGDGEDKKKIISFINKNNLEKNIFLIGHIENIYNYMINSKCFILSSLWEDPGFVLLEAAISRTLIFSSDCESGPKEIIKNNENGILFLSNNQVNFIKKFEYLLQLTEEKKKEILLKNLKLSKKFTLLSHYKELRKILN